MWSSFKIVEYGCSVEYIMISGFELFQPNCIQSYIKNKLKFNELKVNELKTDSKLDSKSYFPYSPSLCLKITDIDLNLIRPRRAGVIVSVWWEGIRYFCFGKDWDSGEMTDFGGSVMYKKRHGRKKDKNVITGALREFEEETLRVFGTISEQTILNGQNLCLLNQDTLVIFVSFQISQCINPWIVSQQFNWRVSQLPRHEVSQLIWISQNFLEEKIAHNTPSKSCSLRVYDRIRDLLFYAGNFYEKLI